MLGRLFAVLPLGSVAFRLNLMSAVLGAGAAVFLAAAVWKLGGAMGLGDRAAAAGGLTAAAVLVVSPTFWWLTSIAEKYSMFLFLFSAASLAAVGYAIEGGTRRALASFFLAGLAFAHHYQSVYLAVPLLFILRTLPGRRERALALVLLSMPWLSRMPYTSIRAAQYVPVNWYVPDNWSRLLHVIGFQDYANIFAPLREGQRLPLADMATRLYLHLAMVPWDEIGLALLLALGGLTALNRSHPWTARGAAAVAVTNVLLAFTYSTVQITKYDLPLVLVLAGLAGVGCAAFTARWRYAPLLAAVIVALGVAGNALFAMRDRDYVAADHERNLVMAARGGGRLFVQNDPSFFLAWHASVVERKVDLEVHWQGQFMFDHPERRLLAHSLGDKAPMISRLQEGSPLFWTLAAATAPRGVFADYYAVVVPTRGTVWRGILIKIRPGPEGPPLDETSMRLLRRLRVRALLFPRGAIERGLSIIYGQLLGVQGRLALEAGDADAAARIQAVAARVAPGLPEMRDLAGRIAFARGRINDAEAEWAKALKETGRAYVDPYLGLASAARRRGDRDRMLDALRAAAVAGLGGDHKLVAAGDLERREGRPAGAEELYRQGVAGYMCKLGKYYTEEMQMPAADRALRAALEQDPRSAQACFSMGQVAMLEERFGDAIGWLEKAVRLAPGSRDAADYLARARRAVEWMPKLSAVERRLAGHPDDPVTLCDTGNAYWYVNRQKVAEHFYRRAVELDPGFARGWNNLGSALADQSKGWEAIRAYRRALREKPGYAEAMINLGAVHLGLGRTEEAVRWLNEALKASPGNPEARRLLAQARGARGL